MIMQTMDLATLSGVHVNCPEAAAPHSTPAAAWIPIECSEGGAQSVAGLLGCVRRDASQDLYYDRVDCSMTPTHDRRTQTSAV